MSPTSGPPSPIASADLSSDDSDHVVLLSPDGAPIGTALRSTVHTTSTPLHLAFSCYLLRSSGEVLVTRRALSKRTWPGVWTNSFCGHPRSGESLTDAVVRHAQHELGLTVHGIEEVLPDFRYTAVDASGIVENEFCPVLIATTDDEPVPNPDEVMDLVWADPEALGRSITATPWAFSPWMVLQLESLGRIELPGGAP